MWNGRGELCGMLNKRQESEGSEHLHRSGWENGVQRISLNDFCSRYAWGRRKSRGCSFFLLLFNIFLLSPFPWCKSNASPSSSPSSPFPPKNKLKSFVEPLRPLGEGRAASFWRKAPGCLGVVRWTGSWAGRWQSPEPQDTAALTSPWVHVKPLPKSLPNSPCRASHLWQWSWVPVGRNCRASVVVHCNQSLCPEQRDNQRVETVGLGHFRTRREILSLLGDGFKHEALYILVGKKTMLSEIF